MRSYKPSEKKTQAEPASSASSRSLRLRAPAQSLAPPSYTRLLQVALHDLRNLEAPLHTFDSHTEEVFQVACCRLSSVRHIHVLSQSLSFGSQIPTREDLTAAALLRSYHRSAGAPIPRQSWAHAELTGD